MVLDESLLEVRGGGGGGQHALKELQRSAPNFHPENVMLDFELAEHTAFRTVFPNIILQGFPNIILQGCLFHYKQCLYRRFAWPLSLSMMSK